MSDVTVTFGVQLREERGGLGPEADSRVGPCGLGVVPGGIAGAPRDRRGFVEERLDGAVGAGAGAAGCLARAEAQCHEAFRLPRGVGGRRLPALARVRALRRGRCCDCCRARGLGRKPPAVAQAKHEGRGDLLPHGSELLRAQRHTRRPGGGDWGGGEPAGGLAPDAVIGVERATERGPVQIMKFEAVRLQEAAPVRHEAGAGEQRREPPPRW